MKIPLALVCLLSIGAVMTQGASIQQEGSQRADNDRVTPEKTLDRFFQSSQPPLTSYRARRVLDAATFGSRMTAHLEAWTSLDSDGTFRFEVSRESGSDLLLQRVLVAALQQEEHTRNRKETGQAELTLANYDFLVTDNGNDELVEIRMLPRRKNRMLLNGTLLVKRNDGDLVRIDGSPSERPSVWTRSSLREPLGSRQAPRHPTIFAMSDQRSGGARGRAT